MLYGRSGFVEVVGGVFVSEDKNSVNGSDKPGDKKERVRGFQEKRRVVVEESKLPFLFRRDWELAAMPVIRIRNTNRRPTVILED